MGYVKTMGRSEHEEQKVVVEWLRALGICYCAVPNGVRFSGDKASRCRQAMWHRAEGLVAGAPDLLLFSPPPADVGKRGVALEMKSKNGVLQPHQKVFLERLRGLGWEVVVAKGADEAIKRLEELGYGKAY